MTSLWQDFRYGWRTLLRTPGYTAVVVAVLALGIGANCAVFSIVNAVLLRPLPYQDPARLYRVHEISPKGEESGVSPFDLMQMQARSRSFRQAALAHWQNVTLTGRQGAENVYGGMVSGEMFAMLGSAPAAGRVFQPRDFEAGAPGAVVLSYRLWSRRFAGERAAIGSSLLLNGRAHTIVGVMAPDFLLDQKFELWTPWRFTGEEASRRELRASAAVRLARGMSAEAARAELSRVFREIAPEDARRGWDIRLTPMAEHLTARYRSALMVAWGAVSMVQLIACLNAANLAVVRWGGRGREVAVRAALGASRGRIVRQLLTESLLLAGAGGVAGLAIGAAGAKLLVAAFPERMPLPRLEQTRLDGAGLLFACGLVLLTGLVFGTVPALRAASPRLSEGLSAGGRGIGGGGGSRRLRGLLVVMETALSLVLLTGAGLMLRSLDRLLRVDPGFDAQQVLTLRVPLPVGVGKGQQQAYYGRMLDRLGKVAGEAGLIAPLPLADVDARASFMVEGHPVAAGETQVVKIRMASAGYFRAMGIAVRRGRVFDESDGADGPGVVVINESLARRYFAGEDPIGRRVTISPKGDGPFLRVIGVVKDVKDRELTAAGEPEMYRDYRQFFFAPFAVTMVVRAHGDPRGIARAAQKEIRAAAPDQPVSDVKTMRQVMAESVAEPRFYTLLLGVAAGIAVALAATGMYGVLAGTVRQQAREIGIRVALGAPRVAILKSVVGQALALVSGGIVLGAASSLGLTRLIAAQLYHTAPTDAATLGAVGGLMLAVAAAAAWTPARRALRVDAVAALNGD